MGDIFQLPEDIIHHILSYLETHEATQTSLFCKKWYSAWLTCPTLNFHEFNSTHRYTSRNREKFLSPIKRTLQRYQEQKIHIKQFILDMFINDFCSASQVDEWIGIAVQNGVKRLELQFSIARDSRYTLPRCIFEAKSLRELSVKGDHELSWIKRVDDIMFNHLQELHLSRIIIDDDMFQAIIAGCPLIENLSVSHCEWLNIIKVNKLDNLKKFTVYAERNQGVEVEAPNLQYLYCNIPYGLSPKFYQTEKLKYLEIADFLPSETFFDNFGYKFPQVKDLRLTSLYHRSRINISSPSLKHITLGSTYDLSEIIVDAPNAVLLELRNIILFPKLSLTNAPSQWVFKIVISICCCLNANHFYMMKQMLAKVIRSKISLVLRWSYRNCDLVEVQEIPICPMVEVEDVHLYSRFSTPSAYSNFLDALFRTCHPKAIIVHRYCNFPRFLFKNLIKRRKGDSLRRHETKSWYQELKEVKLEIYDKTNHQWQPSDWKSLPEAPQSWSKVCFRLEWKSTS